MKNLKEKWVNFFNSTSFCDIILYIGTLFCLYFISYGTMPFDFNTHFRIYTNGEIYKVQKFRPFSFYSMDITQCKTIEEAKNYIKILKEKRIKEKKWTIVQESELSPQ